MMRMGIDSLQTLKINRLITDLTVRYGKQDTNLGYLDISYYEMEGYIAIYLEDYNKSEYRFRIYCRGNEQRYERCMATGTISENAKVKCLYESVEKGDKRILLYLDENSWYDDFIENVSALGTS